MDEKSLVEIKQKSNFEFNRVNSFRKLLQQESLYEKPEVLVRKRSDIDFNMDELYNLSQISKEEVKEYSNLKEQQIYLKLRERRLSGGSKP